jgi:hypothetical protein
MCKHRSIHLVIVALAFIRSGLVRLVIVSVVVRFGIDGVVALAVRCIVVTGEVIDGMLRRRMLARLYTELLMGFSAYRCIQGQVVAWCAISLVWYVAVRIERRSISLLLLLRRPRHVEVLGLATVRVVVKLVAVLHWMAW